MTSVTIPVPQSPIGFVEIDGQRYSVFVPREWYRFFGLIQTAIGGSTDVIGTVTGSSPQTSSEEMIATTFVMLVDALIDASSIAVSARARAEDLQRRVENLESQAVGRDETLIQRIADLEALIPRQNETGEILKQLAKLTSGTYTPTLFNDANLDASTAYSCQYLRNGDVVTVSGRVDIDPTLTATITRLGISLPIASNLANSNECAGAAGSSGIAGQVAAIGGDSTNDRAQMVWLSGDVTNTAMYFIFTYRII